MKLLSLIACLLLYWAESSAQFLPVADHRLVQSLNQEIDFLTLTEAPELYNNPERNQLFTEGDILDSSYIWLWDFAAQSYELIRRNLYSYNAQGFRLTWLESYRNGSQWVDLALSTYTYDGNNNLVHQLSQAFNGSEWNNNFQILYTFNSNNDQLSRVTQDWVGNVWVNDLQQVSTYDNDHHELTLTSTFWNGTEWQNSLLRTQSYDLDGYRIHQLIQNWNGSWVNNQQVYYTYDLSGLQETALNQTWVTDHWEDNYRLFYTYDDHLNVLSILWQEWDGIAWQDDSRNVYTYDTFDNLTVFLVQNFISDTWVNDYQFSLMYDEKNNQVSEVYQIWEDELTYQDSTHFYFTLVSGIKALGYHDDLTISPNLAHESISIHTNNHVIESMTISIYSQAGVKVMEKNMDSLREDTIDISKLPPGAYHIVAQHDQGIETRKFIKL